MSERPQHMFDATLIWLGTVIGGWLTLSRLNAILSVLVLLSTLIYTWQRILRPKSSRHRYEEEE